MEWIDSSKKVQAMTRLFCFHHAGGAASFFKKWAKVLPSQIELVAIQLPGREARYNESLLYNMDEVINDLFEEIKGNLDKPYFLFGHSMGAIIAFEIVRKIRSAHLTLPFHLIVSACRAPQIPNQRRPLSKLPDCEFLSKLKQYNGIPNEMNSHIDELLEVFLPIIRADFTISETYQYLIEPPLPMSITALCGSEDPAVSNLDVVKWQQQTCKNFKSFTLPGDHFFIKTSEIKIVSIIKQMIEDELGLTINL